MAKWADFCITAVQYNYARTHIERVEVRKDEGSSLGGPTVYQRADIVAAIASNQTFVTSYLADSKWQRGEEVRVVNVHGLNYLRTDPDRLLADNLGSLPEIGAGSGASSYR